MEIKTRAILGHRIILAFHRQIVSSLRINRKNLVWTTNHNDIAGRNREHARQSAMWLRFTESRNRGQAVPSDERLDLPYLDCSLWEFSLVSFVGGVVLIHAFSRKLLSLQHRP